MRINFQYCGERSLGEFTYLGDATPVRPDDDNATANDAWTSYVYLRDNVAGPTRELWYHAAGCHAWLVVTRSTRDHQILAVEVARDVALARTTPGQAT
jgi:methylglutamate dehydrogenase subunit B